MLGTSSYQFLFSFLATEQSEADKIKVTKQKRIDCTQEKKEPKLIEQGRERETERGKFAKAEPESSCLLSLS